MVVGVPILKHFRVLPYIFCSWSKCEVSHHIVNIENSITLVALYLECVVFSVELFFSNGKAR